MDQAMKRQFSRWLAAGVAALGLAAGAAVQAQPTFPKPARYEPTADERTALQQELDELARAIAALPPAEPAQRDAFADVAVYYKAAEWTLHQGEFFTQKDVAA